MLSKNWEERTTDSFDFVIIGSGYGGAITAARLAQANLPGKPSICIIERGKEWEVGTFPDTPEKVLAERRWDGNPLGLYDMLTYRDISVIKGNGLGGTSLVNANVAIVPDDDAFRLAGWPASLTRDNLLSYYDKARKMLDARPHPDAANLLKVQALQRRAEQLGGKAEALNIAVNFRFDGPNEHGVEQKPCINCGDCVTGCNVHAKNTLYMNYLPVAAKHGAQIFTRMKVEYIQKADGGGWLVRGRYYPKPGSKDNTEFKVTARNVVLAAGSINSTEILMRSEMHGLKFSPRLGSGFNGNADFFGLSYNGDYRANVLGFGNHPTHPRAPFAPGPTIVAAVNYNGDRPIDRRMMIEDLSFPAAYVNAAKAAFALVRGEDSDTGDDKQEKERLRLDLFPGNNDPDGALNHTMLYLCMGFDDARGSMVFETPFFERDGRMKIEWDDVGRQPIFTRINEELRRHTRAQGGSFIQNPMWSTFNIKHLITAHPLGGCPLGEDYMHGAVDEYGRVFSGDGTVHENLYVADGSLIPSALGVNPFLTISALTERIAERKIEEWNGKPYPKPKVSVGFSILDPVEVSRQREGELEKLFKRAPSLGIDVLINSGKRDIDTTKRIIQNDEYWKGFFPKGHVLNMMSSAIFTGFKKRFFKEDGRYAGNTSDTDGRINAKNALEELNLTERTGDLEPGRYILLRYVEPPWQGFYDVFRVINENLLVGRVYLGPFPNGRRVFTFPMTRVYSFEQMTVEDHRQLWAKGAVPTKEDLTGAWRMDAVSNANHLGGVAFLKFDAQPDGRFEARYRLMGIMEGLVVPSFLDTHFQLNDFTPFHDEIRRVDTDYLVGKYIVEVPEPAAALLQANSLGVLHVEGTDNKRFGFYYTLTRAAAEDFAPNTILRPFLEAHLPDGVGMTFDEEMVGTAVADASTAPPEIDPTVGDRVAAAPTHQKVECSFKVRMLVNDVDEFVDGVAHEAGMQGSVRIGGALGGLAAGSYAVDERRSRFYYLKANERTKEAEMVYHIEFESADRRRFVLEGRKFMQKDTGVGSRRAAREVLSDYTTLHTHIYELKDRTLNRLAIALLKFRTFEDLKAVRNLVEFIGSFRITGTSDPQIQLQARMKFLAFTGQFVQREYDPLALEVRTAGGAQP